MDKGRSMQQVSEQERAAQAWHDVGGVSASLGPKYGSQARRLATLIQTNGLAQTVAFLRSKRGNEEMTRVYGHLCTWVMRRMREQGDLLEAITRWSSATYRRATTEALAYALWLRRFAEARGWGEEEAE